MRLRKGDIVMVIAGKDRGKTGKILSVDRSKGRVVVEKLNMVKRHQKPTQQQKQGGIIEKAAPIALSNVMYFDVKSGKPSRIGISIGEDGKRKRIVKRSGDAIDVPLI